MTGERWLMGRNWQVTKLRRNCKNVDHIGAPSTTQGKMAVSCALSNMRVCVCISLLDY